MSGLFNGTGPLLKLVFRKDRLKIIIWLLCLIGITLAAAGAYPNVYTSETDIQGFALTMKNPAMEVMLGPGYELEEYTSTAQIFANEMLLFTLIAVAAMNILIIGKTTRDDEETGKLELLLSLPVGKLAYLITAIIEGIIINILLIIFVTIGLFALNIEGIDFEGALLYGSLLGTTGLVFASLTAVFAQLLETSRGATGIAFSVLIIAYLLRGIGDVQAEILSFFSPLGWPSQAYVFVHNHWWPIAAGICLSLVLFTLSLYLNRMRDLGAGFIRARKGKDHASPFLKTTFGFIMRQQRTTVISWAVGLFLLSASFASIMGDLETYFSDLEIIQAYLNEDLSLSMGEQFAVLTISIISLFSLVPVIMTMLKLKGEEAKQRIEHFYSRAVSRSKMMYHYFLASIFVAIIMQLAIAFGFWAVSMTVTDYQLDSTTVFQGTLSYLPAIWFVASIVVLLIGFVPKATNTIWAYFGFCFLVLYLKDLLEFPNWLNKLSVFEHVPKVPIDTFAWTPMIVLTLCAIVVHFAGVIFYNKRDIYS